MSKLTATVIDVGWGDSILLDSEDSNGDHHFALVDSNDTTYNRSSFIFLRKHFEREYPSYLSKLPLFDFVLLTHSHSDHGQGLKETLRRFGAQSFWYPKSNQWAGQTELIRFAQRSNKVTHHQSVDDTKKLPQLGNVDMEVLWPPHNHFDKNENNNSVVLHLKLDKVSFLLTGDAEVEVWNIIANKIPKSTKLFKVPHHGSNNGTIGASNNTPWLDRCPKRARLAISAHNRPYGFPDQQVINLVQGQRRKMYRTDEQYHLSFETDGTGIRVKYSRY